MSTVSTVSRVSAVPTMSTVRVAVVGGGHQGLVAAVVLARAGLDVTVLEAGPEPGGCLWTGDVGGLAVERGAVDHGGLRGVADELGLDRFGLRYVERDRLCSAVFGDGEVRDFEVSVDRTAERLGPDADAYRALAEQAGAFFAVLDRFPVPPTPTALAGTLAHLRGGDETFRSLLSSAEAVVERRVDDPHLRAALALYAAHGQIPPWAPGSGMLAFLLPGSHGSPAVRPEGGGRAVVAALVTALGAAGGQVRTGAVVRSVARGAGGLVVELDDGERLAVDRVVSTLDVRRTTALLADPPAAMTRSAVGVASGRLNVSELTVALTLPEGALPERLRDPHGPITFVQDGLGDLRRGFGDLVAGRLPGTPWAMVARADVRPADDDGWATGVAGEAGGTRRAALWLSSVVPLHRDDGAWTPRRERAAADRVLATASRVLGVDLAGAAGDVVVSGPAVWATRLRSDGNPNHLDLTLDQMLGWRPPGLPGHRTPVPGLYLAGSGTHPGGGLSGTSGRSAATALLTDLGTRSRRAGPGPVGRVGREVVGLWRAFGAYLAMRREGR